MLWVVLSELRMVKIMASPRKCALTRRDTKYLWFLVGLGTIRPLADKVEAIHGFLMPQNNKQLRSFLELINYYHRFMLHFSELADPLMEALKGWWSGPIEWTTEMTCNFELLKKAPM